MALVALPVMRGRFDLPLAVTVVVCAVPLFMSPGARSLARLGRCCVAIPGRVGAWRVTVVGLLAGKARHAAAGSCSLPFSNVGAASRCSRG